MQGKKTLSLCCYFDHPHFSIKSLVIRIDIRSRFRKMKVNHSNFRKHKTLTVDLCISTLCIKKFFSRSYFTLIAFEFDWFDLIELCNDVNIKIILITSIVHVSKSFRSSKEKNFFFCSNFDLCFNIVSFKSIISPMLFKHFYIFVMNWFIYLSS